METDVQNVHTGHGLIRQNLCGTGTDTMSMSRFSSHNRMHSSRTHTVRCSGCPIVGGGGVCPEGYLSRRCLPGGCLPKGGLPWVGCLPRGLYTSPRGQNSWHTLVKNITFPQFRLWTVISCSVECSTLYTVTHSSQFRSLSLFRLSSVWLDHQQKDWDLFSYCPSSGLVQCEWAMAYNM